MEYDGAGINSIFIFVVENYIGPIVIILLAESSTSRIM
jgi:hypothetical protein